MAPAIAILSCNQNSGFGLSGMSTLVTSIGLLHSHPDPTISPFSPSASVYGVHVPPASVHAASSSAAFTQLWPFVSVFLSCNCLLVVLPHNPSAPDIPATPRVVSSCTPVCW